MEYPPLATTAILDAGPVPDLKGFDDKAQVRNGNPGHF